MAEIWKEDRLVAKAPSFTKVEMDGADFGFEKLRCYYFGHIKMSPPVLFEHLAGTALLSFLEQCTLIEDDDIVEENLRYVHGRSETMKGASKISSVLLVKPEGPTPDSAAWLTHLPAIYKRFLSLSSREPKTA